MAFSITRKGRSILMDLWWAEVSARRPSGYSDLDALTDVYVLDAVEKPEDCSDENCWRHGGDGPCTCSDEEGGTWQPGC